MKKLIFYILLLTISSKISAQNYLEAGFYGGFGFTEGLDKRYNGSINFKIGYTTAKDLSLGGFFSGFKTTHKNDSRLEYEYEDCDFCFRGYYGGFYGEQHFLRKSFFFCNVGAKLGFGGINYSNRTVEKEYWDPTDNSTTVIYEKADKCFVMVLKPYGGINFEIGNDFIISAGVEYRNIFFNNLHYQNYHIASGNDLNGLIYLLKISYKIDL